MRAKLEIKDSKAFRAAWNAGLSCKNIAMLLNCSDETVRRRAVEFGYPPRKSDDLRRVKAASGVNSCDRQGAKSVSLPREPWAAEAEVTT